MPRLLPTLRGGALGSIASRLATAALLATVSACSFLDKALSVDAPSRIPATPIESPANANLLLNGAIADFQCAYGSFVVVGGIVGEELVDATLTADRWPYDQRNVQPQDRRYSAYGCTDLGVYQPIQQARASTDRVLQFLQGWTDEQVPGRMGLVAKAAAYSGYSYIMLGEMFCSAAISTADQAGNITYGPEIQPSAVLAIAEERFTTAIDAATQAGDTTTLYMALVGRARVRQDLGRLSEAKADAEQVPADFVFESDASAANGIRQNRVWSQNNMMGGTATSVGPVYQNFMDSGVADPRVPVVFGMDTSTTGVIIYVQQKYLDASSPMPIATGTEAQLIVAEADLAANDVAGATAIIDGLHQAAGLPAYTGGTVDEVRTHLIQTERRSALFLTGNHLGDVIRYGLTLSPASGTPYFNGGDYGTTTCLPLPDNERLNNPNI